MEYRKVKLFTYASKYSFESEFDISVFTSLPKSDETRIVIPISECDVEIPIPEVSQEQLINGEIEQLKSQLKDEQEKSLRRQQFWKDRISNLQSLESK